MCLYGPSPFFFVSQTSKYLRLLYLKHTCLFNNYVDITTAYKQYIAASLLSKFGISEKLVNKRLFTLLARYAATVEVLGTLHNSPHLLIMHVTTVLISY